MSTKSILAVGLDLGSTWTRCVICSLDGDRLVFKGAGITESAGWSKSRVVDPAAVGECVQRVVHQAEAMAHVSIDRLTAGCGGLTVRGANTRSRIEIGRPREIEQRDVNRSLERASRVQLQEDRMVLQLFPQDFVVDDHPGHRDPRKMLASAIEANAHLITMSVLEHSNVIGAINQACYTVDETVYEGLAACYASVLPEDRRDGIALLDIGSQSSELVVYYGDTLQLASSIPVCGDHFTRDIAHFLRINFDEAAVVKEQFGSAVSEWTGENSFIELPPSKNREPREASRRQMNEIIQMRAEELFKLVRRELARVGMERALMSGLVLTGGGALLRDVCDVAEHVLDCQVRRGLPIGIVQWPEELNDPEWCTVAGLTMYSARLRSLVNLERQSIGLLGKILR